MPNFAFRLQRVLQWQGKVCHIEEEGVRLCRVAVTAAQEQIVQLQAQTLAAEREFLERRTIAAWDLVSFAEYRVSVIHRSRKLEAQQQALVAALEEQMRKLANARRQLQQLETLRDRSLSEYRLKANRDLEALALESYLSRRISSAGQMERQLESLNCLPAIAANKTRPLRDNIYRW